MEVINHAQRIREAETRERTNRDAAWLNLDANICGMKFRQMTVKDYLCLDAVDSPLLLGVIPSAAELAQFLWVLSPDFSERPEDKKRFCERVGKLPYADTLAACREFVEKTFLDAPQSDGKASGTPSYYSWITSLVDTLASEYGWTPFEVLELPLRQVFQLVRAIRKRRDPKAALFNPLSDKARCDWLKALNEERTQTA